MYHSTKFLNCEIERFAHAHGLRLHRDWHYTADEEEGSMYLTVEMVDAIRARYDDASDELDEYIEENELDDTDDRDAIIEHFKDWTFTNDEGEAEPWLDIWGSQACLVDWEEYLWHQVAFMSKDW